MSQATPPPPDSGAVDKALETLAAAIRADEADDAAKLAKATTAFDELNAVYADQSRKYQWAEAQRQEFWRLYNFVLKLHGVPKQPTSTPYTVEQFQEELAKLPASGSDAALLARAEAAEAKVATFASQKAEVGRAMDKLEETLKQVEAKLK